MLAKWGARLDWPHRRTDDKASRAWTRWAQAVARRRWIAAGAGLAVILALAFAATDLQLGTSDANTVAKSGDAKDGLVALEDAGIGEGSLLPHEILDRRRHRPDRGRALAAPGRRDPWRGRARERRLAPRRHSDRRGDPDPRQRDSRRQGHARRACATPPTRPAPTCASAASRRRTTTSSTPSTAASR